MCVCVCVTQANDEEFKSLLGNGVELDIWRGAVEILSEKVGDVTHTHTHRLTHTHTHTHVPQVIVLLVHR